MFNVHFFCAVLLQRRVEEVSKVCESRSKEQEKSFRLNFQWTCIKYDFQSDVNECHCFCYLLQNKIISFTWFALKFLCIHVDAILQNDSFSHRLGIKVIAMADQRSIIIF